MSIVQDGSEGDGGDAADYSRLPSSTHVSPLPTQLMFVEIRFFDMKFKISCLKSSKIDGSSGSHVRIGVLSFSSLISEDEITQVRLGIVQGKNQITILDLDNSH